MTGQPPTGERYNAFTGLMREVLDGHVDRRDLLKRAGAAGLSGAAIASLLVGHSRAGAQGTPSALSGQTIDMAILGIEGWPPSALGTSLATELFAPYAQETYGYTVNFSFEGAPFDQLFQRAVNSLSTGSAEYNIIISDSQWLGALADPGYILQLNDIIASTPELAAIEFEPTAVAGYQTYPDGSDQLWGLPQEGDTVALFVRQDLMTDETNRTDFEATAGFPLPQTFEDWEQIDIDQYEQIAAFFTGRTEGLYGTALQWSVGYDYISCYLYPFMFSTGGQIIEGDVGTYKVEGVLNSQVNADAMVRNKGLLQYAPPNATTFDIGAEVDVFTSGTVATCMQWSALGPQMLNQLVGADMGTPADTSKPVSPDDVLIVPPPGFRAADGTLTRIYTLGGQPWVINAANDEAHRQVAIDFMKWWYLPETQLEFARRGGNPCVTAVLDDPSFEDIQPHFRAFKYMLRDGRSRDFWHDPNYSEMLRAQQEAFSAYLTDVVTDPMVALTYAACVQQGILYDAERTEIEPSGACDDVSLG